jgi:predicted NAD/FAD-dependent oxidoreductase
MTESDIQHRSRKSRAAPDDRPISIAVVGAGLSGLVCAKELADRGHRVRVFDKARGPGGRMATRRVDDRRFDHGAQYFTIRDHRFARSVEAWRREGVVAPWNGRVAVVENGRTDLVETSIDRFVGVPGMNAVCRHLARDLNVAYEIRIQALERESDGWRVCDGNGRELGSFDAVVVSAPAPQTAELVGDAAPNLAARAAAVEMDPCWAVMTTFPGPLGLDFDGAFVNGSPLSWIARNTSKPGRPGHETWILHASPEWSRRHLELGHEETATTLLESFRDAAGSFQVEPDFLLAHRWRFALPLEALPDACLFDPQLRVAACGDWCGGPRVEGAFLSGLTAAERILGT